MTNLLSSYRDIIETYLTGLRTQLNANFTFHMDLEEGSVTFKRSIPCTSKDVVLVIKYTFDKETLECEKPSAEVLKICLWGLANTTKEFLFPYDELTKYAV